MGKKSVARPKLMFHVNYLGTSAVGCSSKLGNVITRDYIVTISRGRRSFDVEYSVDLYRNNFGADGLDLTDVLGLAISKHGSKIRQILTDDEIEHATKGAQHDIR